MKHCLFLAFALSAIAVHASLAESSAHAQKRHVVLVVWDGMRPDFITEAGTPRLWSLARDGVRFARHHSVYPTSTEVNGAALATGVYPNRNGILANREYRPAIASDGPIDTGEPANIKRGDDLSGGRYLSVPTIAEIAHSAGLRTAIAGAKSVVFLQDRHAEWTSAVTPKTALTIFAAAPMPPPLRDETQRLLGPFLNQPSNTNEARNAYTTRALTEVLWRDGLPDFSLLWLSEPDLAQHETAPGSESAVAAIGNSDRCLGTLLDALAAKKQSDNTDILVVSDHGFSTIERAVDVPAALNAAGFSAHTSFNISPKPGEIMVVGNGGTVLFYVIEHEAAVTGRLVEWLEHSEFAGTLFTRDGSNGTFKLETVHLDSPSAPDVVMAFRWNDGKSANGTAGRIIADSARTAGKGSHATLSPFDIHNIFVAAGPDFRRGAIDEFATGNIDIAPTILRLLRLSPPQPLDGRVVREAFADESAANQYTDGNKTKRDQSTLSSGPREGAGWRQELQFTRCADKVYLDEGNGGFAPK